MRQKPQTGSVIFLIARVPWRIIKWGCWEVIIRPWLVGCSLFIALFIYIYISFFVLFFCLACIWVENCILVVSSWWTNCLLIVDSTHVARFGIVQHEGNITKVFPRRESCYKNRKQQEARHRKDSYFRWNTVQSSYHEKYPNRCSKKWQKFPENFSWCKVCTRK